MFLLSAWPQHQYISLLSVFPQPHNTELFLLCKIWQEGCGSPWRHKYIRFHRFIYHKCTYAYIYTHIYINAHLDIYTYIYTCICVCVFFTLLLFKTCTCIDLFFRQNTTIMQICCLSLSNSPWYRHTAPYVTEESALSSRTVKRKWDEYSQYSSAKFLKWL